MQEHEKNQKQIIDELYQMFSTFKDKMEDPNYIQLENTLNQLVENQMEMKMEMKELKRQLLNPFDGVVVETRKNSQYIETIKNKEDEFASILEEHRAMIRWKDGVNKFGFSLIGVMGGIITFLLNRFLGE